MTAIKDIYDYIDGFAPFESAEKWDNVGVLVGDKNMPVRKAILALDITCGVIEEAEREGAQLIISHHPIIFGGLKSLSPSDPVYKAAQNGIACLCAHTNLDKSPVFGVNTCLARAIGLENCRVSEKNDILFIADTPKETAPGDMAAAIKKSLGMGGIAFTEYNMKINKVGLCSGAGGSEIYSAAEEGCGAFVTGEIKHHELLFANSAGMSVFILGHYRSEDVVIQPLADRLGNVFPGVEFKKSEIFSDGVGIL